ncbi:beta strand repeat-containing protein [Azospirillum argentinense]
MPQTWYRDGSVTLINGSTAVTGFGTLWTSQVFPGDVFSPDGDRFYEVAAVASNTALTLRTPYTGTSRPPVAQVNTITPRVVDAAAAQTDEITINDFVYQFTSDASPTMAEICAGLAARISASPTCPMTAQATDGTLVLTAKTPGHPLTVIVSANLTSRLTAAASAGSGYMVIRNFAGTMAADIANRMADLVRKWQLREDEFVAWMAGDPRGGPNGDGKYPLTDTQGNLRLVETPAALLEMIDGGLMDNVQLVIDAIEDDVVAAQLAATEASEAAVATAAARNAAQASEAAALASETRAKASETAAKASADAGAASEAAAAQSALSAGRSETSALTAKTAAETANTGAQAAKTAAEAASSAAKASETASKASETNAKTSETNAAASAQTATTRATASATSASQAASSATGAAGSASGAAASAQTATTRASEAAASAAAARTSETNAKTSETNAAGSASAAAGSASNAATSAQAAAGSATAAETAKTGAQASAATATNAATTASGSATAAQTSAAAAKASETAAATSATQGQSRASAAAASATQAAASATTAATKAGEATTSANAAATSASAAQSSANTAATHLSNVQANATAAANARTAAEGARDQAAASAAAAASGAQAADASAQSAAAGASTANTAAAVAGTSATDAVNAKVDAVSARDIAQQMRDQASAQRELAAAWASSGFNVPVQSGAYSALHWATMAKEYADTAGTIVGGFSFSAIGDGNQQKFTASMPGDTIHFVQGSNVNINYDAALKRLTFSATSKPVDTEHAGIAVRDDNTAGKTFLSLVPASIAHQSLGGAGAKTHAQIDAHLGSVGNPHGTLSKDIEHVDSSWGEPIGISVADALHELEETKAPASSPIFRGTVTLAQDPSSDLHAATKRWVDALPSKRNVRYATTGDLGPVTATTTTLTGPPASYTATGTTANGSASVTNIANASSKVKVGATVTGTGIPASTTVTAVSGTTVTLSANVTAGGTPSLTFTQSIGALTIDGGIAALNDRVLVKDQSLGSQRGIYYLSTIGTSSVPWVLTRSTDADSWTKLLGAQVLVEAGAALADTAWMMLSDSGGTLGTTTQVWQAYASPNSYSLINMTANGIVARAANGGFTVRAITGTPNEISVAEGAGVAGNPTISLPSALALGGKAVTVGDANFTIQDTGDTTKLVKFELGGLTTGTTRTLTVPNASGTLSLDGHSHDWSSITTGKPTTASGWLTDTLLNTAVQQTGYFSNVRLWDTDTSHSTAIALGSNLTANRTLTITTGDANRTLTISGDATVSGTNTGDQTITLSGPITGSGTGIVVTSIQPNVVGDSHIRQGAATSVIGRAANSAGNVADIAATTDNTFLARRGGTLTFTSPTWNDITSASKPTTLSGYGITDAQPLNTMLTTLAGLDGNAGVLVQTAANAVSKRGIGTANASDILDRTAGDSRYAQLTGNVTFGGNLYVGNGHPSVNFRETDAATDTKAWTLDVENGRFLGVLANDSNTAWTTWLNVQRSGMTVSNIALAGSALTFNGSNILTTASGAQLSGATFTGPINVNPATGSATLNLLGKGNAGIELGRVDGTASTPLIDFHSGATATDYDVRLVATGGNGTSGNGGLQITAGAGLSLNGYGVLSAIDMSATPDANKIALRDAGGALAATSMEIRSTAPVYNIWETDAAANSGRWRTIADNQLLRHQTVNDAYSSAVSWLNVHRTANQPTLAQFQTQTETYLAPLGTTVGSTVLHNQCVSGSSATNTDYLRTLIVRGSGTNTSWASAGWRIQRRVDATDQAFIQFGGEGDGYGVALGSANATRLLVPGAGNVTIDGQRVWHDGNQQALSATSAPTFAGATMNGQLAVQTYDGIRHKQGAGTAGFGIIHRNDGGSYYLLLTNNNDANGTWNGLRPLRVALDTGGVYVGNGLGVAGGQDVTGGHIQLSHATTEQHVKFVKSGVHAGFYGAAAGVGLYDWLNNRGVWNYNIAAARFDVNLNTNFRGNIGVNAGNAIYFGREELFGGTDTGGADYGWIAWTNDDDTYAIDGSSGENGLLRIGTSNDGPGPNSDNIALTPSGDLYLQPGGDVYVGNAATRKLVWHEGNQQDVRSTATPSFAGLLANGPVTVSTTPGSQGAHLFLAPTGGGNGREGKLRFGGTFASGVDQAPRLVASLRSGFSSGAWGNEYLDVYLNNQSNDAQEDAKQARIARFTTGGLIVNGTITGALNGNAATATTATTANRVANALTINGTVYDGSSAQTITIASSDGTKLPLAGGTITGGLTVNNSISVANGLTVTSGGLSVSGNGSVSGEMSANNLRATGAHAFVDNGGWGNTHLWLRTGGGANDRGLLYYSTDNRLYLQLRNGSGGVKSELTLNADGGANLAGLTVGSDGNLWMQWCNDWLSNVLARKMDNGTKAVGYWHVWSGATQGEIDLNSWGPGVYVVDVDNGRWTVINVDNGLNANLSDNSLTRWYTVNARYVNARYGSWIRSVYKLYPAN